MIFHHQEGVNAGACPGEATEVQREPEVMGSSLCLRTNVAAMKANDIHSSSDATKSKRARKYGSPPAMQVSLWAAPGMT